MRGELRRDLAACRDLPQAIANERLDRKRRQRARGASVAPFLAPAATVVTKRALAIARRAWTHGRVTNAPVPRDARATQNALQDVLRVAPLALRFDGVGRKDPLRALE